MYLSVCLPSMQRLKNLSSTSATHLHDAVVFRKVPESIIFAFEWWDAAPHAYSQTPEHASTAGCQALKGCTTQGGPRCVDCRAWQKGAVRIVQTPMVRKLWFHTGWRSDRGMPCPRFGWPRSWAQVLYASWTMQHRCILASASMVYLKCQVLRHCIAGFSGGLQQFCLMRRSHLPYIVWWEEPSSLHCTVCAWS